MLQPGGAVGNLGEVGQSQVLLAGEVVGAVVGGDGVHLAVHDGPAQGAHVVGGAQGRAHDELGPLEAGEAVAVLVQEQILGAGLHPDGLAPLPGSADLGQAGGAGEMDHGDRTVGQSGHGAVAADGLGLHVGGAGDGMACRTGMA